MILLIEFSIVAMLIGAILASAATIEAIPVLYLAGAALSIVFFIVPTLREWFNKLPKNEKQGLMLALCAVVALVYHIFGCYLQTPGLVCSSLPDLLQQFSEALIGNVMTYVATKDIFNKIE